MPGLHELRVREKSMSGSNGLSKSFRCTSSAMRARSCGLRLPAMARRRRLATQWHRTRGGKAVSPAPRPGHSRAQSCASISGVQAANHASIVSIGTSSHSLSLSPSAAVLSREAAPARLDSWYSLVGAQCRAPCGATSKVPLRCCLRANTTSSALQRQGQSLHPC